MRLGLLVVAASLGQVSAQNDGSGEDLMDCHTIRGDIHVEQYSLQTCNQTGSWLEEGGTTCFFGTDSYSGAFHEYAGCGQQINCREKYDAALARGLVNSETSRFCIENILDFPPIETPTYAPGSGTPVGSGYMSDAITVTLCCEAISEANKHDQTNVWGATNVNGIQVRDIQHFIDANGTITLTNDQVAAVATEEEEDDDDDTVVIVLASVGGALVLGSVAYIIKKKVYDGKASFTPLEFLL